jgi:hypothetical protein
MSVRISRILPLKNSMSLRLRTSSSAKQLSLRDRSEATCELIRLRVIGDLEGGVYRTKYRSRPSSGELGIEEASMNTMMTAVIMIPIAIAGLAAATVVNFDTLPVGTAPAGWSATKTGTGNPKWTVEKDDTAPSKPNVLKQSGQATYPVCLKDDTSLKDGFVEVKFKPISGREDQAGGVVWRAKDANNYYVARANALENNVTIYHTVDGRRTEKKRVSVKVATNQWHTLRVEFHGVHFIVIADGQKALEWDDQTFTQPGKVGVWTKADSVTLFDDFSYGT